MKNKCRRLLRLLIVIIFCIGSIVGLSACSGNKGNEDIDPPNQEIPSDPSLDTIFDSDGTGADTNGLTYQKFISRSKKYKIAWITGYNGSDYADVVIPETVDKGYTVTKIEEKAWSIIAFVTFSGPVTFSLSPKEQHQPRKTGLSCTVAEKLNVWSLRALKCVSNPNLSSTVSMRELSASKETSHSSPVNIPNSCRLCF